MAIARSLVMAGVEVKGLERKCGKVSVVKLLGKVERTEDWPGL